MKKIAIQGFKGSYHEIAAKQYFGTEIHLVERDSFINLFKSLDDGSADMAVMAIENTIAGPIIFNYSLLSNSPYSIVGETFLRIEHCLMALDGQSLDDIHEVHSHPMALNQCIRFFANYPHIKLVEAVDTGLMAQEIANLQIKGRAAIAGVGAAKSFNLSILKHNIEDNTKNFTRFLILEKNKIKIPNANKATISFGIAHEIGGLHRVFSMFSENNINVMSLQSTPFVGNAWEYVFHLDIAFDNDTHFQKSKQWLQNNTINFKILGEYVNGI